MSHVSHVCVCVMCLCVSVSHVCLMCHVSVSLRRRISLRTARIPFFLTDARSALEVASNLLMFSNFQIPSNLHPHFSHVLTLFDMMVQTRWGRCAAAPTDLGAAWAPSPSPSPTTPSLRVSSQLHRTAHGLRAHRLHWEL